MKGKIERLRRELEALRRLRGGRCRRVFLWTADGERFAVLHDGGGIAPLEVRVALVAPNSGELAAQFARRWLSRAEVERLERRDYLIDCIAPQGSIPQRWVGVISRIAPKG
ncbi:MAG: hypothetical protein NZ693_09825 [Thermoflexales bacterium]|nr:hypothetical protein [Thermoflexales bacterium]